MSQIIKSGSTISIADVESVESKLPLGTYNLTYNELTGFRLEQTEDFILPKKIYGDTSIADRAITVYKNKDRNFGLLLSGLRGAGKSLLMKKIAIDLHQPVIIINNSFQKQSNEMIRFLTDPALGDCTILLDEFEKKFNKEDVTPLTLLDGPYNTHHFYILTCNTTYINENLTNRPGRIYYHKSYCSVDDDTVKEVGLDLLNNKDYVDELVLACEDIRDLSFDMLISIINDVNLFNQSPKECIKAFGFNSATGAYMQIFQRFNGERKEVTSGPIYHNAMERYIWIDNVKYLQKDGTATELSELRLDLEGMTKISKSKYKLQYQLTIDKIDRDYKDNFIDQVLEFEIELNSRPSVKYIF